MFALLWEGISVYTRKTTTEKEEVCWVKTEFRKISMSLSVNKSVGGLFLCPLPLHHPGPEGTAGLFNVASRAVCPDVGLLDTKSPKLTPKFYPHVLFRPLCSRKMQQQALKCTESCAVLHSFYAGIQEGTQCTKCKNEWALKTSIALLYVLCTLLTIAVAVLGYKGKTRLH